MRAQHYKICERFKHKEKQRALLEKRVEELESRQAKDDEVACIINRYWNCLDEDVQLLLQRFDAEANVDFQEGLFLLFLKNRLRYNNNSYSWRFTQRSCSYAGCDLRSFFIVKMVDNPFRAQIK